MLADGGAEWVWCEESEDVSDETGFVHRAVMTDDIVGALMPRTDGVYLDATLGAGGHTKAILDACDSRVVAMDRDGDAISAATRSLAAYRGRLTVVHSNFGNAKEELARLGY